MRKLFILTAIVGLVGAGGYAPGASASSVALQLTSAPGAIAVGGIVSFDIVMTIDGTGGGDGNVSSTTVTVQSTNPAALGVTAGFSGPTASGVGLTNFAIRDAGFTLVGACVNTATTGTCIYANPPGLLPPAPNAGNYGGITTGIANFGTFTVGTITLTGVAVGASTVQVIIRPGLEWADGFANALPTQPTLGSALVTVIPEPATASLIGLGLVGLLLAGRRSRA